MTFPRSTQISGIREQYGILQMKEVAEDEEGGVSLVPSAPPAHVSLSTLLNGEGDLLSLEPPVWVPDSHASGCSRCKLAFR